MIETIETKASTETGVTDWNIFVKLALIEMYGDSLGDFVLLVEVKFHHVLQLILIFIKEFLVRIRKIFNFS